MTLQKVTQAAKARGLYFDGERGYSDFYCILTRDGYRYFETLEGVYKEIKRYRKVNYRIPFRR